MLPLSSFGVEQNLKSKLYRIYFIADTLKLYLGDEIITEEASKALESDDILFVFEELKNIMGDDDFVAHLEKCIAFGGDD